MIEKEKLIEEFHRMWDGFPGIARLINKRHIIVASNEEAVNKGFRVGVCCAKVGSPELHKECKATQTLREQKIGRAHV